jgi:DNA-binding GntR family transcriptional regulator
MHRRREGSVTADARTAGLPAGISPVVRPAPLRQSVYEALVELVVGGRLRPGEHLVETELARQLRVSRQPVREALHRLEAEGWVDLRPNQGAFVHVPTGHAVDELRDARELLEVETARLAARSASTAAVARLREVWRAGEAAAGSGDAGRIVAANDEFHAELAAAAGNAVLAELASIVGRRVRWYYRQVAPVRGQESWAEHQELIDAAWRPGTRSSRPASPASTPSAPEPPTTARPVDNHRPTSAVRAGGRC